MIRLDDAESSFRRGYVHGALFIVQRLKEGWTAEQLAQFIEDALTPWRENEGESLPPKLGDYTWSLGRFIKRNQGVRNEDEPYDIAA